MAINIGITVAVTLSVATPAIGFLVWLVRHLMSKRKPGPSNHPVPDALPIVDMLSVEPHPDDPLRLGYGDALNPSR